MFTTEDEHLARAVQKLREGYANQLKHRKCTMFLAIKDVHTKEDIAMTPKERQIHNDKLEAKEKATQEKAEVKQKATQEKAELKQKAKQEKDELKQKAKQEKDELKQKATQEKPDANPKLEIVYCHATKMDGKKCTAKAKNGCNFCGRHTPKI